MILYRDQKRIGPMNVNHLDNTLIMINKVTTGTEIMSRDLLFTYTVYTKSMFNSLSSISLVAQWTSALANDANIFAGFVGDGFKSLSRRFFPTFINLLSTFLLTFLAIFS